MLQHAEIQELAEEIAALADDPDLGVHRRPLAAAAELLRHYTKDPITIEVLDPQGNSLANITGDTARKIHQAALVEFFERNLAS